MDQEYCSTVYTWFEKCGIISNIRTHLRQNLINALKNKEAVLRGGTPPKAAKQYVYDLLIAEYLFSHNYAYTLSVFASEAPLLINFHNQTQRLGDNKDENREKLQSDYIVHTLETLGINPNDPKGQYIVSQYINNDISLLLCILKCIIMFSFDNRNGSLENTQKSFSNVTTQTECLEQLDKERMQAMKRKLLRQKEVLDRKLREREMVLKEQAIVMEEKLVSLNGKLRQIQNIMKDITSKEEELKHQRKLDEQHMQQREMELSFKEKLLRKEECRYRRFEEDLKKLQSEISGGGRKEVPQREASITRDIEVQTDFDVFTNREEEMKILIKEKEDLNNLVQEQQLRIEQITQRALQLSRQVEEIHFLKPVNVDVQNPSINVNTIISESSSTDDILHDAKVRLKRLEEESLRADQYYYNFINTS